MAGRLDLEADRRPLQESFILNDPALCFQNASFRQIGI
jgi:hypothetical protein